MEVSFFSKDIHKLVTVVEVARWQWVQVPRHLVRNTREMDKRDVIL